jgi:hypothetical protein
LSKSSAPRLLGVAVAVAIVVLGASGMDAVADPARETACSVDATTSLVRSFARAYSRGRVAAADQLFAPEPRFQWFSTGPPGSRLGARAYDRSTLAAYFRACARVHERIRLVTLAAGYDAARDLVHFHGKLVRRADDLRQTPHEFKGAADCAGGRPFLIVWSM